MQKIAPQVIYKKYNKLFYADGNKIEGITDYISNAVKYIRLNRWRHEPAKLIDVYRRITDNRPISPYEMALYIIEPFLKDNGYKYRLKTGKHPHQLSNEMQLYFYEIPIIDNMIYEIVLNYGGHVQEGLLGSLLLQNLRKVHEVKIEDLKGVDIYE